MSSEFFNGLIDFFAVTGGGQVPLAYKNMGHVIKPNIDNGLIGGNLEQVFVDQFGKIHAASITVSTALNCGHLVNSIEQVAGYCQICGRVCCLIHPECLQVCEFTGITVCNRHYAIKNGVVVSSIAQKGLWRIKAKLVGKRKKELNNAQRQIPYRSK